MLFCSVEQNSRKVVHALLNRRADANDTDEYNRGVLHAAADNQNLEIFRLLPIYGACYKTYAEAGEASPEFTCMEMESTLLPSYGASWRRTRERLKPRSLHQSWQIVKRREGHGSRP